jgi:hypothetical protein
MLLLANYKDGIYRKRGNRIDVLRGQLAWSIKGLADRWGWGQGRVSRFLKELKNDEQIEYQKSNLTTLITIINYDQYQGDGEQTVTQTVSRRRADGEQTVTSKEVKELNKKEKKEYISPRLGEHENVRLTRPELDKLNKRFGEDKAKDLIGRLSDYLASKGDKYKSHYATILGWVRREGNGATKPTAPTMTAEQEANRNNLKTELASLYDKLKSADEVPEGHPNYGNAQIAKGRINKRIDEIEKELGI